MRGHKYAPRLENEYVTEHVRPVCIYYAFMLHVTYAQRGLSCIPTHHPPETQHFQIIFFFLATVRVKGKDI